MLYQHAHILQKENISLELLFLQFKNILFLPCIRHQGNYIPTSDEGAESQEPEYDVILALSLTKWVHLNWGDAGIKRLFQRVYRHLRPEGKFILEPQPFNSYTRKKKLTVG